MHATLWYKVAATPQKEIPATADLAAAIEHIEAEARAELCLALPDRSRTMFVRDLGGDLARASGIS
jgi:hypothetical protein